MIYKREEYVKEDQEDQRFPVKQVEVLEPVGDEGEAKYIGQVTVGIQTPAGVQRLPVSFEIECEDIEDAFDQFAAHANPRVEEAKQQIQQQVQQMRQQSSNRIVRPGEAGAAGVGEDGNVIDFNQLKSDK